MTVCKVSLIRKSFSSQSIMNHMSLNTTQNKAPVYNVDKNYAIRKEKIFLKIRLSLLVVIIRFIIMSKCTCICNTQYTCICYNCHCLQHVHILWKRNIEKNTLHKWNVLQQKNFKLGYFIFLHKSPKRLILDPLKRNKKQLHLSTNISASKTALKHRISSSIYSMTECSRKVGVRQNYAIQSHSATYLLVIFLSVE